MQEIINFCLIYIGFCVIGCTGLRGSRRQTYYSLTAPVFGCSLYLVFVFTINRLGFPVGKFSAYLYYIMVVASIAFLAFKRQALVLVSTAKIQSLFLAILAVMLLPVFIYGYEWITFTNDDMANYVLAAQRFFENGYFDGPYLDKIRNGTDYSQMYWYLHVQNGMRSGSELLLAAISGITEINPFKIFTPTIVLLFVFEASMVALCVYHYSSSIIYAIIGSTLFVTTQMALMGVVFQLIAQVLGMTLLLGSLIQCESIADHEPRLTDYLTCITLVAALLISYPEAVPFLCLPLGMKLIVLGWSDGYKKLSKAIAGFVIVLLGSLVLTRTYFVESLRFLFFQATGGQASFLGDPETIVYSVFLKPKGIAATMGTLPMAGHDSSSAVILYMISVLLLMVAIYGSFRFFIRKNYVLGYVIVLYIFMWVKFTLNLNDFVLFKLSMYVQPILISLIVLTAYFCRKKYE